MKQRLGMLILAIVTALSIAGVASAADVETSPHKLVAGEAGGVELTVDPNRLWPKPRSEILFAWWCWDIDPRPPECESHYCDSPVPDDPICAIPKRGRGGKLTFEFESQKSLVGKARGACGRTDFVLRTQLADGGVSEAEGTVEIDCGR